MAVHVIIDARNKRVFASKDAPCQGTVFFGVDLISEAWHDFSYFVTAAADHEKVRRFAYLNSYLRAAMTNLLNLCKNRVTH